MSAQTFRCCPHCADDQPHIEKDTHELPCTLCYGDVEHRTAAIAERAREWRAALNAVQAPGITTTEESRALALLDDAEEALAAAVDAEREAQPSTHPNPQP